MITAAQIGAWSLNISFVLYLIVYVPQVIHNHKAKHLQDLSLMMHFNLYIGYFLDLLYGVSMNLQWQYKTVSVVGLSLLILQHLQLTRYAWQQHNNFRVYVNCLILLVSIIILSYFFLYMSPIASQTVIAMIGYTSRVCFISYIIPQLIKNHRLKSAQSISQMFVILNLILATLDLLSSWCLHWGWPNQLGAPIMIILTFILWRQGQRYVIKNN